MFPGAPEVAGAQFETAWAAHESNNFSESSRLLTEHLANYADRNTDNRGKAGYWAARDSERAGKVADARIARRLHPVERLAVPGAKRPNVALRH